MNANDSDKHKVVMMWHLHIWCDISAILMKLEESVIYNCFNLLLCLSWAYLNLQSEHHINGVQAVN